MSAKKTAKSTPEVKVKDLKAKKNPKGGGNPMKFDPQSSMEKIGRADSYTVKLTNASTKC